MRRHEAEVRSRRERSPRITIEPALGYALLVDRRARDRCEDGQVEEIRIELTRHPESLEDVGSRLRRGTYHEVGEHAHPGRPRLGEDPTDGD